MPFKDTLTLGTVREPAVNINFSVGVRGDNGPADIMLIQAIFNFLCRNGRSAMSNVGFSLGEAPSLTGYLDHFTEQAIWKFQRKNANRLLSVDGLIEPAKYKGRTIKPAQRYMTITLLHFLCMEMAVMHSKPHYIDSLIRISPQLGSWLS